MRQLVCKYDQLRISWPMPLKIPGICCIILRSFHLNIENYSWHGSVNGKDICLMHAKLIGCETCVSLAFEARPRSSATTTCGHRMAVFGCNLCLVYILEVGMTVTGKIGM